MNTAMKGITRQEVERNKGIPSNWEIGYLINHIALSKFHELNSDKYFVLGDKIEVENLYSLPDGIKLLQKKLGKMLLPRYDDLDKAQLEGFTDKHESIIPGRDEYGNSVNWIDDGDVLVSDEERKKCRP